MTPTATPSSTPARQQKKYSSHTTSSESKFVAVLSRASPMRSKEASARTGREAQSDSFLINQAESAGPSSQSILFSPDRAESVATTKSNNSSTKNSIRAFIASTNTDNYGLQAAEVVTTDRAVSSQNQNQNQNPRPSSRPKNHSAKPSVAATTADILSANKAAKIAAMASVKGASAAAVSPAVAIVRSQSRPKSANKALVRPSSDRDGEKIFKKSQTARDPRPKAAMTLTSSSSSSSLQRRNEEDRDLFNRDFHFREASRSLISPEHSINRPFSSQSDYPALSRFKSKDEFGEQKVRYNSFSNV